MVTQVTINKEYPMLGAMCIGTAAILWGTIAIFGKIMMLNGLSPEMTGCVKLLGSSVLLCLYFLCGKTSYFKITWRDTGRLIGVAFATQTVFNFSYYPVVKHLGVTGAGVLLYTMPIFLTIWSVIFFKEKLEMYKILGVALCFSGSILAITGGQFNLSSFSPHYVALGLIAAISFSLVTVFCKVLLRTLRPLTVIFYAFFFGGLMMVPFVEIQAALPVLRKPIVLLSALGLALIGSVIPYVVYYKGIELGVDLSKAGVISVLELVTSILLAILLFGETLNLIKWVGVLCIVLAIILIQNPKR